MFLNSTFQVSLLSHTISETLVKNCFFFKLLYYNNNRIIYFVNFNVAILVYFLSALKLTFYKFYIKKFYAQ